MLTGYERADACLTGGRCCGALYRYLKSRRWRAERIIQERPSRDRQVSIGDIYPSRQGKQERLEKPQAISAIAAKVVHRTKFCQQMQTGGQKEELPFRQLWAVHQINKARSAGPLIATKHRCVLPVLRWVGVTQPAGVFDPIQCYFKRPITFINQLVTSLWHL